ncbi:MAG: membrane protein insertase YidC [Phycisphaeraceae bacterium]
MKRFLITLVAIVVGVVFAIALVKKSAPPTWDDAASPAPAAPQPAQRTTPDAGGERKPATDRSEQTTRLTADQFKPIDGLHGVPAPIAKIATIGSNDPYSGYKLEVDLSALGASILNIHLTDYQQTIDEDNRLRIYGYMKDEASGRLILPFAARAVIINGTRVDLVGKWELIEPDTYRTTLAKDPDASPTRIVNRAVYAFTVADRDDHPVLRITRTYSVPTGITGYEVICKQQFENLSGQPLRIVWEQNAQGDMPVDEGSYLGDRRTVVTGYYRLEYNPSKEFVYTDDTFVPRTQVLKDIENTQPALWSVWPNPDIKEQAELVWLASLNRYFAAAVHQAVEVGDNPPEKKIIAPLDRAFDKVWLRQIGDKGGNGQPDTRKLIYELKSKPITLAPGESNDLNLALFAGPRKSELFGEPPYKWLTFKKLVVYSLGGPCAMCTFQWLAHGMLWFLKLIEGQIITIGGIGIGLHDWGIAIIILVMCVRGLLHPITKKAQVNMMKMGKMMQALQPEMEKLKKKYKDNQQKLQQETMKLYREKGVNPANMLGCLPMFLQTPIWIALYAMLFYAIELRHEPAFYGIFQAISGGHWGFLGDLSRPDNFISFGGGFNIPLPFINLTFSAINILPILMAVVFYFNQKLTTPPPANEQAAQQQKIMKYMMLLFPIFLYSAPSGLTLYILASTGAGIIDSIIVRKHIREQEEAGTLFEKKPRKPGGLINRMQNAMQAKQRELNAKQRKLHGKAAGFAKRKDKRHK